MTKYLSCSFTETVIEQHHQAVLLQQPEPTQVQATTVLLHPCLRASHPFFALTEEIPRKLLTFSPDLRAKTALYEDR